MAALSPRDTRGANLKTEIELKEEISEIKRESLFPPPAVHGGAVSQGAAALAPGAGGALGPAWELEFRNFPGFSSRVPGHCLGRSRRTWR